MRRQWFIFALLASCLPSDLWSQQLNENCTVNILNRTVQVSSDGSWAMPNVPSFMGRVRARATCVENGATIAGQSDFFTVQNNGTVTVSDITFDNIQVPVALNFSDDSVIVLDSSTTTVPSSVYATYANRTISGILTSIDGINFISSNPNIVSVDANGVLTAVNSGSAVITARLEGAIALKQVNVSLSGDMDGDGLPDDYENANGLNPNDPVDAFEDQDKDGLTALEEFQAGTDVNLEDTDGDGISDSEELIEGVDDFITNPLLADSDGDGFFDGLELLLSTNPNDNSSFDLENALESIAIQPDALTLIFNGVDTEVSDQIWVIGNLIDGNQLDITNSFGTNYTSSDLSIANFGLVEGEIFGSDVGEATITASNNGYSDSITVTVTRFDPVALSAIAIPGYANNVDVQGDYAYVAAGSAGLVIVDVTDRAAPAIVGQLDTAGTAIDVKVSNTTVYLADGLAGVHIIDVTDVTSPQLISTYDTGGLARDLAVDLQYIYVADDNGGLDIINISDPAAPFSFGAMDGLGKLVSVDIDQGRLVTASDSTLHIVDIADPELPVLLSSINVGNIKSAIINDNHVYLAAASNGYRVFNITEATAPVEVVIDGVIAPRDLVLSGNLLMFAEQLFPNVVAYMNVADPDNVVFQGVIDLFPLGDYAGTGIAADSSYVYVTEESHVVASDYEADGDTRLFIAQHRQQFDNRGIAPTINMTQPISTDVLVEGTRQIIHVDAVDDIAVKAVEFVMDGQVVFTDSAEPYQMLLTIPRGTTNITLSANAIDLGDNTSSTPVLDFAVEPDSDEDGLSDNEEVNNYNTFPDNPDSDADGLSDGREVQLGTDPLAEDSDGDGLSDAVEVANDTDPLNPDITPPNVVTISPVAGATDIPESTLIAIDFDEPLLNRSIGASDVDVRTVGTNIGVSGRLSLTGNGYTLSFEPNDLLSDYTEYQVTVSGVKDSAGNVIAQSFTSTFTTGNEVDIERPYVTQISPLNSASNVPVNAIVSIQLNERIDESTFSNDHIYIYDRDIGARVAATAVLGEDRQSITITPNTSFAVGRGFTVYVSQLRDLFNNQISARQYYFTTSFEADVASPVLLDMSIRDGYTDVPNNAVLAMQFDEPISSLSLSGLNLLQGGNVVPLQSRTLSDGNRRVRLRVANFLEPNTEYVLRAEGVEDTSGNLQAQAVEFTFSTGDGVDLTRLSLSHSAPYRSETNVPTNTRLVLQYNQRLNPLEINSFNLYAANNSSVLLPVDVVLEQPDTIVITPRDGELSPNTQYYVRSTAPIDSITGATAANIEFYFTTGSGAVTEPVAVTDWTTPEGYTAFPTDGTLIIDLSTPIDYLSCDVQDVVTVSDGSNTLDYTWSLSSNGRTRLALTPTDLVANSSYTVTLDGLCDYAGNTLSATRYNFSTASGTDTTAPTLVSVSPANNATGVSVTSPVTWTFSEPVWLDDSSLASNVYLTINGDTYEENKLSGELSWNAAHTALTFTPSVPYPGDTQIQLKFAYSYLRDISGNTALYSASYSGRFTTESAPAEPGPVVVQVVPTDGAVDIDRNNAVVLTFSKPLDYRTLTDQALGLYANGQRISTAISRSYDNRTIVLSTPSVPAGSVISVIATDGVRDLSGNSLSDFVSLYSTAVASETTRPSVNTVYPGNNANSVDVNKNVVLYINEPIDISTVTAETLRVSQEGVLVSGTLAVSGDAQVITFTPDQPWSAGSVIQVFAQSGIHDLDGNALNSYQSLFRTQADNDETTTLQVIATSHLEGLPTNAQVGLRFNKPLNPLTVSASSVIVYRNNNTWDSSIIAPDLTLVDNDRVLVLSMPSGWSPAVGEYRSHKVRVTTGVEDIYGNSLSSSYHDTIFYIANEATDDTVSPTVTAMSPVDGIDNVGINAQVHIRFDEAINPLTFTRELQGTQLQSESFASDNRSVTYIPHEPFAASSEITLDAPAVEDSAGNVLTPYSVSFTTSSGVDLTPPSERFVFPGSGQTVAVNALLQIQFTEPVTPTSIHSDSIRVYDRVDNRYIALTRELSSDYRTVTLVPDGALAVGRSYRLEVLNIYDMAYNRSVGNWGAWVVHHSFTASFEADVASPVLLDMSIRDGYTDVPTNAVLAMQFDEPINGLSLSGLNLLQGGNVVPLQSRTLSDGNRRVRLRVANLLEPNTEYVLRAEGVEDTSGNLQAQAVEFTFSTGDGVDLTRLSLSHSAPYRSETNVPTNTRLVLQYNQRLNPLEINSFNLYAANNSSVLLPVDVVLEQPDTIVITPRDGELAPNTQYYVRSTAPIDSITGATAANIEFYFTTGSGAVTEPVAVTDWTTPEGYTAFPSNGTLIIDLSTPIDYLSCDVQDAVTVSDGSNTLDYTWSLSNGRTRLELTPTDLVANSSYTVTLDGLCDYAGNTLSATRYNFSAGSGTDTTAPTLVSVSPVDNATGVSVTSPVTWTFSEPVWLDDSSLASIVYLTINGDTYEENKLSGEFSWNAAHTALTFTPSVPYPGDTQIQLKFAYSHLRDISGNTALYSASYSGRFTTESAPAEPGPVVVQVVPTDGAVDIDRNNAVVLTFSKPLDYRTLTDQALGLYANGQRISTAISRSYDNRTIVLSSPSVPAGSVISVIATDGVRDLSGNSLSDFVSLYSTAVASETTRPSVNTVYPGNNANSVDVNKNVVLYINEPIDISTVTAETLRVSQEGVLVSGTLAVSGDAQVITFTPDQPWGAGSVIQVFAQSGIHDLDGNALNSYQSLFRTQADNDETTTLQVIATSHLEGLPTNAQVGLRFNKPLNPLTVSASSVIVYRNNNTWDSSIIAPDLTLVDNDRVLVLSMPSGWSPAVGEYRSHKVRVTTGVEDIYGNSLSSSYHDTIFYIANEATDDTVSPTVTAMSPVDGIDNVGINAQVHIRFDEAINPLTFTRELQGTQLQSESFASDNRSVTYIPHEPFAASSEITLDAPAVEDSAGNVLTPYSVSFTTSSGVDLTPPSERFVFPGSGQTVAVNAVLQIQFTEPVTPTSIHSDSIRVYDRVDNRYIALTRELSSDYRTVTLVPDGALAVGRSYRLEVLNIYDMAYNRAGPWVVHHSFTASFEADVASPVLLDMSIRDGYTDVPTNAVLAMQFDEPINGLSLSGLNLLQGGNVVPLQSRTLSDGNRRVRLRVANLLEPNTEYVLRAEGVEDTSGNLQAQAVEFTFSTGDGVDLTRLSLSHSAPYRSETNVPTNTRLVLQYNQRLNPLEINSFNLYAANNSSVLLPVDVVLEQPDTIVITPRDGELAPNTQYYVRSTAPIDSITGATAANIEFYFTTGSGAVTEPVAVTDWTTPEGYTAFPSNGTLIIDLSTPIDYLSCDVQDAVTVSDGSNTLDYTWSLSNGRTRLELTPTDLVANSSYTVTLDGLCDYAGNTLSATRYNFSTASGTDTTAPTLVSVSPANNATGVSVTSPVTWTFSEPVWFDNGSLSNDIFLYIGSNSGNRIAGNYEWSNGHTALTFTPLNAYPNGSQIRSSFYYPYLRDMAEQSAPHSPDYDILFTTE